MSLADVASLLDDETTEAVEPKSGEELTEEVAEDQSSEEATAEEGDDEEVEFEGKAYKVPKEIKEALLRQADYTQKTQAVAEQRRTLEEKAQLLQQREQLMSTAFEKAVELREVQNRLSQFEQIDWQSLADSDPAQATKLNLAYQQLQREAQQKYSELTQTQAQQEQLNAHQLQQTLAEAQKELRTRLPNFTPEVAEKIKVTAREYGLTDQELASVIDPRHVHILHDAMKWRALQAQKPQALKKVAEAPKAIPPKATQPKPRTNKAAEERLRKHGRPEDLAAFL
ncbi:MAG: hypothetical protein MUF33_05850 [Candidatus Nanopelagicales bacterium]|nr:hypothetical protein [Candidatus Nanopelagicales bacterium]